MMRWLRLYLLGGLLTGGFWWFRADAARAHEVAELSTYARLSPDDARLRRRRDRRGLAVIVGGASIVWPLFWAASVIGLVQRLRRLDTL